MSVLTLNSTGKPVNRKVLNFCRNSILGVVNFQKYSVGGYPEQMIDKIWNTVAQDKLNLNSKIAVVNDICLEATWFLMQKEFSDITLLCTDERIKQYTLNSVNNIYSFDKEITCINVITIEELNTLEQKFDLIIANPPFSCANKIIDAIVTFAKCSVVLAPISCYRNRNLWEYVDSGSVTLVDPDKFFDASITKSLCICSLNNSSLNKPESYRQLKLSTYDTKYRNFYQKNQETRFLYTFFGDDHIQKNYIDKGHPIYVDRDFVADVRFVTLTNHDKNRNSVDVRWNILKQQTKIEAGAFVIHFESEVAVNNFRRFFYENQLSVELIRGLHEVGTIFPIDAIPHIDYSVDRDYEHLTLDDLMKILEEES